MSSSTYAIPAPSVTPAAGPGRRLGRIAAFAAFYTYALIVFGGIVRITGSGMGCGDDWPRCNGEWIPVFTFETMIEYGHRLLAAGIGFVVLGVVGYAIVHRHADRIGGRGGALRPLLVAGALLVAQVMLGAITVWLELPTEVTVAHFVTALLFMAMLIEAAARAGSLGGAAAIEAGARHGGPFRLGSAHVALALGLIVVALGAMTANTPAAPLACRGFPLCNGSLLPAAAAPVHIHWTHRLVAFLLTFHMIGAALAARSRAAAPVARAAVLVLVAILIQIGIAAALVTLPLPASLQAVHLAVGAAIWFAIVRWSALARLARGAAPLHSIA